MQNIKKKIKIILAKEAVDISPNLIDSFEWALTEVPVREILVDKQMWARHSKDPRHKKRFAQLLKAYNKGETFLPLIVMHHNMWLVDGYTRLRVYKAKGVRKTKAYWGRHPNKKTEFKK